MSASHGTFPASTSSVHAPTAAPATVTLCATEAVAAVRPSPFSTFSRIVATRLASDLLTLAPRTRKGGAAKVRRGSNPRLSSTLLAGMERGGNNVRCRVGGVLSRAERARLTYKPSTAGKQAIARESELEVVKKLGGKHGGVEGVKSTATTKGHGKHTAMDVTVELGRNKLVGLEVKTFIDNTNDKITMHPESRRRKEEWMRKKKACGVTILVDARDKTNPRQYSGNKLYAREGFGAFTLASMRAFSSFAQLKNWIASVCR